MSYNLDGKVIDLHGDSKEVIDIPIGGMMYINKIYDTLAQLTSHLQFQEMFYNVRIESSPHSDGMSSLILEKFIVT